MTSPKNSFVRDSDYSILPTHIITEILKHLTISDFKNASQVCKSWYYGSTDPYFIRKLCARITSNNFQTILDYNQRYYSKFIISDLNATNEHALTNFLQQYKPYLRDIEFFYCYNADLNTILNLYIKQLTDLDTLAIKSRKNLFEDIDLGVLPSITKLKHFHLYTQCEFSNSDSVKNLYTFLCGLKNLVSLEVHSKFDAVFSDFVVALQKLPFASNLTALSLHATKHKNFLTLLNDLLSINFTKLQALKLYDAYHDSDEIGFRIETDEYCDLMERFSAKFIKLREFYVGYANDEILKNIFKFMKNLKVLGVSCAHRIEFNEIDIFFVIEKLQFNVYTYYDSFVENDHPVESNVFRIFHNKFPNLQELKINGEVKPETLTGIVQNCPNLEVLHISGLLHVYHESHKIFDRLTRLKILKINSRTINRAHN